MTGEPGTVLNALVGFDVNALPQIAPEVWQLRPDFAALSIVVSGTANAASGPHEAELLRCAGAEWPPWGDAHLDAWRAAYKAFGAKPQRTPSSAEALRRRTQQGALPSINAIVDLYNAVSVRYGVPVGGEDLAAYAGVPRLLRATGDEPFETVRDGVSLLEQPDPGEVVWRDDLGVTCRRWNWRQTTRTRVVESTVDVWFVLERLGPMPFDALHEAGAALVAGVRQRAPQASIRTALLQAPGHA